MIKPSVTMMQISRAAVLPQSRLKRRRCDNERSQPGYFQAGSKGASQIPFITCRYIVMCDQWPPPLPAPRLHCRPARRSAQARSEGRSDLKAAAPGNSGGCRRGCTRFAQPDVFNNHYGRIAVKTSCTPRWRRHLKGRYRIVDSLRLKAHRNPYPSISDKKQRCGHSTNAIPRSSAECKHYSSFISKGRPNQQTSIPHKIDDYRQ